MLRALSSVHWRFLRGLQAPAECLASPEGIDAAFELASGRIKVAVTMLRHQGSLQLPIATAAEAWAVPPWAGAGCTELGPWGSYEHWG